MILAANTLAFTVCFAVWMMNGVLATFLAAKTQVVRWYGDRRAVRQV